MPSVRYSVSSAPPAAMENGSTATESIVVPDSRNIVAAARDRGDEHDGCRGDDTSSGGSSNGRPAASVVGADGGRRRVRARRRQSAA